MANKQFGEKVKGEPYIYWDASRNMYHVNIRFQDGSRRTQRNFKSMKLAKKWRDDRFAENQLYPGYSRESKKKYTLEQAAKRCELKKKDRPNWKTVKLYVKRAIEILGPKFNMNDLTPVKMEWIASRLRSTGLSDPTIYKHLQELRWMTRDGFKHDLCTRQAVMPKLSPPKVRELRLDIVLFNRIIRHLPLPHQLALRLTVLTMQRKSDILGMEWSQYDGKYLKYRPSKTKDRYTEWVRIEVPAPLKAELDAMPRISKYIITNPYTKTRYRDMKRALASACKKEGVDPSILQFHLTKHLGVTINMVNSNGNIELVSSLSSTSVKLIRERYAHMLPQGNELINKTAASLYQIHSI